MASHQDDLFPPDAEGVPLYVIVERRGNPGLLAGLLRCTLAILGIAFVLVPVATLRTIIGLLQDVTQPPTAPLGAKGKRVGCAGSSNRHVKSEIGRYDPGAKATN